jgi:hypothetical protein
VPAQPSLFEYFRTEFYLPAFYLKEETVNAEDLAESGYQVKRASAEEYASFRELFLLNQPHAVSTVGMLRQQKELSLAAGADLYAVETPRGIACVIAGRQEDGNVFCPEFLAPEGEKNGVLAALHKELGAAAYALRVPAEGKEGDRAFGMMKWYNADMAMQWYPIKNGWFGLALE